MYHHRRNRHQPDHHQRNQHRHYRQHACREYMITNRLSRLLRRWWTNTTSRTLSTKRQQPSIRKHMFKNVYIKVYLNLLCWFKMLWNILLPFLSLSVIISIKTKTFKNWPRKQCLVQLRRALASEAAGKREAVRRRKGSQGLVKASWWWSSWWRWGLFRWGLGEAYNICVEDKKSLRFKTQNA